MLSVSRKSILPALLHDQCHMVKLFVDILNICIHCLIVKLLVCKGQCSNKAFVNNTIEPPLQNRNMTTKDVPSGL